MPKPKIATIPQRQVSKVELATALGVTPKTVDALIAAGMPVLAQGSKGKSWLFDLPNCTRFYVDRQIAQATEKLDAMDLNQERAALCRTDRLRKELKLLEEQRRVVEIEVVAGHLADVGTKVRQRVLAAPSRLSQQLEQQPASYIDRKLTEFVHELLGELRIDVSDIFKQMGDEGTEDNSEDGGECIQS